MTRAGRWMIILLAVVIAGSCAGPKNAMKTELPKQSMVAGPLYDTIAGMDSVLFAAFNNRDIDKLKTLFTEDLEFYHDLGGLTNYAQNMEAFQKTKQKNNDLRRELVPGSIEVYPVKDHGAIQTGMHRFCHTENGKPDCGVFKFVHIWKRTIQGWKISRVVSYGH